MFCKDDGRLFLRLGIMLSTHVTKTIKSRTQWDHYLKCMCYYKIGGECEMKTKDELPVCPVATAVSLIGFDHT